LLRFDRSTVGSTSSLEATARLCYERADMSTETELRRSARWASAPGSSRSWWVPLGAVLVVGAYALATLIVLAVRGSLDLSDDLAKGVIGCTPALAALGAVFGFVGTRRGTLRGLAWIVVVLGAILALVSVAAVASVLLALRSFE
jgi:hypothetical protein